MRTRCEASPAAPGLAAHADTSSTIRSRARLARIEENEERSGRRNRVPESPWRGGREAPRDRDRCAVGLVVRGLRKLEQKDAVADVAKSDRRRQDRRLQKKYTGTPAASTRNPGQVPRGLPTRSSEIKPTPAAA